MAPYKILLGAVPFGFDNIGDEAILENVYLLLRRISPSFNIGVCTNQKNLEIAGESPTLHPPFFFKNKLKESPRTVFKEYDCFIWCGATGLSDYPKVGIAALKIAQDLRLKTCVVCCGMDSKISPVNYKLLPGKKRFLAELLSKSTFNRFDFVKAIENWRYQKIEKGLTQVLRTCSFLSVRDERSKKNLQSICMDLDPLVGADPALLQKVTPFTSLPLSQDEKRHLEQKRPKIFLSLSSQQPLKEIDCLSKYIDSWIKDTQCSIFFLPMNPMTDKAIYLALYERVSHRMHFHLIESCKTPQDIAGVFALSNLVISTRLHALVLAACSYKPLIGISRRDEPSSKIDNFLAEFGWRSSGSVEGIDWEHLDQSVKKFLLHDKDVSPSVKEKVDTLKKRLKQVFDELKTNLNPKGNSD